MQVAQPAGATPAPPPIKTIAFQAHIVEVTFNSGIDVQLGKAAVTGPHWKKGEESSWSDPFPDSKDYKLPAKPYWKRPAAYLVKGAAGATCDLEVKVEVTKSENMSGTGKLTGTLGGLSFTGDCPSGAGSHTIPVKLAEAPEEIKQYRGKISWKVSFDSVGVLSGLGATQVELYFLLDKPAKMHVGGVWAEALRFVCGRVKAVGLRTAAGVTAKVTRYCFGGHGVRYDTVRGSPRYAKVSFLLDDYMRRTFPIVNCYDQAEAVQTLAGAIGVQVGYIYMDPYGFINPANLVGVGSCNNPFFTNPRYFRDPTAPRWQGNRSPFGNHAFCELASKIYDACAGPHLGTESRQQYIDAAIDADRTERDFGDKPSVSHMVDEPGTNSVS